jgi:lipopolysaccharide transport system permease protein
MGEIAAPARQEIIIEPPRGWMQLDLRELWEYRDLLVLFIRRDWLARYQQTLLGPLWHLLQPVLTMAIFVLIFVRVAKLPTAGVPAPLFYLSGLLAWNYFAQNISTASGTFLNNHHLFSKVFFPRILVPVSSVVSNLAAFALQLIPFSAFAIFYSISSNAFVPTWRLILLPLAAVHVGLVSLGVGLWMASSTAKYRDLLHLNQFIIQLWMFATPIIYPMSQLPQRWAWLGWVNPVAVPVEIFRWSLLGTGTFTLDMVAGSVAYMLILVFTGLIVFQRAARSAVDLV